MKNEEDNLLNNIYNVDIRIDKRNLLSRQEFDVIYDSKLTIYGKIRKLIDINAAYGRESKKIYLGLKEQKELIDYCDCRIYPTDKLPTKFLNLEVVKTNKKSELTVGN